VIKRNAGCRQFAWRVDAGHALTALKQAHLGAVDRGAEAQRSLTVGAFFVAST
jgi:hypothetical protein